MKNNRERLRDYARRYYVKNKKRLNAASRKYHEANREEILRRKSVKAKESYANMTSSERVAYNASMRVYGKKYRTQVKIETIKAYGGYCKCCGEKRIEFLSVDHTDNNGAAHRRDVGVSAGYRFYVYLRKLGFPKRGYRLLCFNCNSARGFYGYCPHEKERNKRQNKKA